MRRVASLLQTDPKECYLGFKEGSQNQPLIRIIQSPDKTIQPMHWMLDGSPKHAMELAIRYVIFTASTICGRKHICDFLQNADYDVKRAEIGIVYIDEIDKIGRKTG